MPDHGARDHAFWSASSTARNWACPGALALQGAAPADRETDHAARGTACHEIGEVCLTSGVDALTFLGTEVRAKTIAVKVDEELVESAQTYVDYVRGRIAEYESATGERATLWVEQHFSLDSLQPPFEAGGTGDAVLHFPQWKLLEVVDLKNGMGVVDVIGNPQLRTYGLGAVLTNPGLGVRKVRVTIVQPRVHHRDGRTRSEEFHIADLIDWTVDLLAAMRRTRDAIENFPGTQNAVALDAWAGMWLRPGNCKFCRAEGFCPALKQRAMEIAGLWFDDQDRPAIRNQPDSFSPEELSRTLDLLDLVEGWVNAVRGHAHNLVEAGTAIPDYQLVDKRPRRAWNDEDESKVAKDLAAAIGRPAADFFEAKLRSPAQVEKLIGAKRKDAIKALWSSKSSGTNLVRVTKTDRPPALGTAARHFESTIQEN